MTVLAVSTILLAWAVYRLFELHIALQKQLKVLDLKYKEVIYRKSRKKQQKQNTPTITAHLGKDLHGSEADRRDFVGWGVKGKPITEVICLECRQKYPSSRTVCPYCGTPKPLETIEPFSATEEATPTQSRITLADISPEKVEELNDHILEVFKILSMNPKFNAIKPSDSSERTEMVIHNILKEFGLGNGMPEYGISYDVLFRSMKKLVLNKNNAEGLT